MHSSRGILIFLNIFVNTNPGGTCDINHTDAEKQKYTLCGSFWAIFLNKYFSSLVLGSRLQTSRKVPMGPQDITDFNVILVYCKSEP